MENPFLGGLVGRNMTRKITRFQDSKGFTLVELLIVVIILAILAAIVVPQFASSTDEAKESALDSNLSNLRAAIDLYYQQHGHYPSAKLSSGGTCAGTAGSGAVNTEAAFLDQLSYYTNAAGQACTEQSDGTDPKAFPYGPYLKKHALPSNPITSIATLNVVTTGSLKFDGNATAAGWKFDNKSGRFIADDHQNADTKGGLYDTH